MSATSRAVTYLPILGRSGPTSLLDVELVQIPSAKTLTDGARVRVHVSTAEVLARVRLLGGASVPPGGTSIAQLRLERPVVAGRGDRLILRSYSPATTIGGATVLDPLPPKRRAADRSTLERLRSSVDWSSAAEAMIEEAGRRGIDAPTLAARVTVPREVLIEALRGREAVTALGADPPTFISSRALRDLEAAVREALECFHREQPLRAALPREELRERAVRGGSRRRFRARPHLPGARGRDPPAAGGRGVDRPCGQALTAGRRRTGGI